MVKIDVEDWLNDETENASIAMWQAKPVLYDVTCKRYSNRNQRVAAILGPGLRHAWWRTAGQKRTICEGCKTGSGVIPGPGFIDGTLTTST